MSRTQSSHFNVSEDRTSSVQSGKYYDQAPDDDEQDFAENINSETPGYISIKDFAYDQSNPLHYGYFEESHTPSIEEGMTGSDTEISGVEANSEQDKRQSIILPDDYVINQLAVALYDFEPENDNELELKEGDIVFITYRHGQGWLVAENHERTKTGLVPEEFVTYLEDDNEMASKYHEDSEDGETARPFYLTHFITQGMTTQAANRDHQTFQEANNDLLVRDDRSDNGNWEDIEQLNEEVSGKLHI